MNETVNDAETEKVTYCNFILESDLFMSLISLIGRCPDCVGSINVEHLLNAKMGFAQFFDLSCSECPWKLRFCSSKQCEKLSPTHGRKGYDINRRTIIAFRENGIGYSGIESFCRCMNMPKPMSKTTFDDVSCLIHNAYVQTSHESMSKAANEVRSKTKNSNDINNDGIINISVSGDGAWQKRGYSSLNGVMTLIADGKCIANEVMSKKCKECDIWDKKKDTDKYADWKENHAGYCSINHEGSYGAMEVTGLKRIFNRSVNLYNLRYTFYIGDGDTKSFGEVVSTNPYPGHTITKGECISYVQKRVGTDCKRSKWIIKV